MGTLAFILTRPYLAIPGGARIITIALVMALGLALASVANATDANLVAWWKFDEGAGDTAHDLVGGNDGTVYGATWAGGVVGGGLSFDGIDDYVTVGKNDNVFPNNVLTWSAWIKPSSYTSYGVILWDDDLQAGGDRGIELWSDAKIGAGDWFVDTVSSSMISLDDWHHIAFSSGDAERKLYINGELITTDPGLLPDHTGRSYISIGSGHDGFRGYFCGLIDDVLIYDRALSAEEIRLFYQNIFGNYASDPWPADGAIGVYLNSMLSWSPGENAARHDVYFGTGYNDVNDATTDSFEYKGRQDANNYDPCGLEPHTKYHWRIDEVNEGDANSPWKGNIWSFRTPFVDGLLMYYKFDGSLGADLPSLIADDSGNSIEFTKYTEGAGSVKYGQSSPIVAGSTASADFALDAGFYRLDPCAPWEMDPLRLAGEQYTIELWMKPERLDDGMDERITLIGKRGSERYWELEGCKSWKIDIRDPGGARELRYFHHGYDQGESGLIDVGEWHHVAGVYDRTAGEDNLLMKFYLNGNLIEGANWSELNPADNNEPVGIGCEVDLDGTVGHFFDGLIDEVRVFDIALPPCQFQLTPAPDEYATCPYPENGEQDVRPCGVVLSWRGANKAKWHDVYFDTDFDDVNDANTSSSAYKERRELFDTFYFPPGPLEYGQTYHWRIDEVNGPNTWKGEVCGFTVYHVKAYGPSPADGARDMPRDVELSWSPGFFATSHDVYIGTSLAEVNEANSTSHPNVMYQSVDVNSYDPCGLLGMATTYYWRVDETSGLNTWKGHVWSFTVADYITVDDMESYNGNEITDTWLGMYHNWSGAWLELWVDPCEPVHAGRQSMKYDYDSSGGLWGDLHYYSEAGRTITDPCDWTAFGTKVLTLYFYGHPDNDANTTEQMYVGLEDSSGPASYVEVKYGDNGEDVNDVKVAEWQEWNIELEDFNDGGVDLTDVNRLYIGFGIRDNLYPGGTPGGSGVVYFDDIRLYPPKCVPSFTKPIADFSSDCLVNFDDFTVLGNQWMEAPGSPSADIAPEVPDGVVDWLDLDAFVEAWLKEELWPPEE